MRLAFLSVALLAAACSDVTRESDDATGTGSETSSTSSDGSTFASTSGAASDTSGSGGEVESSGGASTGVASDESGSSDPCGNEVLDPGEVCDGALGLERIRCVDVGYVAGSLACAPDCLALDETGCSATAICGDGEVSVAEACEDGVTPPPSCAGVGEGSGELGCLECEWSVASCCSNACTSGCNNACGEDPADLTGTWTIHFMNNAWQGADPTMIMDLVQDGSDLSGSFTSDAWYLGDHAFDGGTRTGNAVYMHVPMTQLQGGMIMQGTVCGACMMTGTADPQGGLDSDWVGTRG